MRRLIWLFLAALLLPALARAGTEAHRFEFQGLSRDYLLYVPATLPPGPRPLLLVLHGGGGTAHEVRRATEDRFEALADAHGFIVVYPDAYHRFWDTGEGRISARLKPQRDDLAFLKEVIARVEAAAPVDRSRIFATGISRGGHASYMLACKAPGLIRAVASVSMTLPVALKRDCSVGKPLGMMLIQGTADPLVPWGGGHVMFRGRARDAILSAPETMQVFARRNRCSARQVLDGTGAVERYGWTGCAAPTRLDRVNGGGHSWPSERSRLGPAVIGPINRDISGPDEVWSFFSGFPALP